MILPYSGMEMQMIEFIEIELHYAKFHLNE